MLDVGRRRVPIRRWRKTRQGRVQACVHPRDRETTATGSCRSKAFRLSQGPRREPKVLAVGREGLALAGPGEQAVFAGARFSTCRRCRCFFDDQEPGFTKVLGAGSTSWNPLGVTAMTERPRSAVPSGRKRKMPSTPANPLGSVSAERVKRL